MLSNIFEEDKKISEEGDKATKKIISNKTQQYIAKHSKIIKEKQLFFKTISREYI